MLLRVENINKIYHTGSVDFQALHNINLEIKAGEFTALCGPSGSGKTTLLNIIGCIDTANNGGVFLGEENIVDKTEDSRAQLRRETYGFIFQTYNLIPVLTVFENIQLPLKLLSDIGEKEMKESVENVLFRVGLEGMGDRFPSQLSGGQQQRVSIARALVKKPRMVLADEPTANLDSSTGEAIIDLMWKMNQEEGVTFLFSTHDPLVMKHARRIVRLRDGKIFEDERRDN